jgi:hypothetical protein
VADLGRHLAAGRFRSGRGHLRDGEGIPEAQAAAVCARLYSADPTFDAARALLAGLATTQRLQKLESVLTARQTMRDLSADEFTVERRTGVGRAEFLDCYYARNVPVVLRDVCDSWPAQRLWNADYLAERLGAAEVEVMTGREDDPLYEINSDRHKSRMPFDRYAAAVAATERGNDLYLTANNKLLANPAAAPLWDDYTLDERYLAPDPDHGAAFLWFGPGGTVTPLHHDTINVMFNQVAGTKKFVLISPLESHCLYNNIAVYSDVDPLRPDLQRFPEFARVRPVHLTIEPGETLFIPVGWWHHVQSVDQSISVSFTNFAFANDVEWFHPNIER